MQEEIRVAYGKAVRTIRQNKKISQEELQVKKSELFVEVEQYESI